MPGLSLVTGAAIDDLRLSAALADLRSPYDAPPELLFKDRHLAMTFSGHEGYPRYHFEDLERVICLEGIVYNRPLEETYDKIRTLSDAFVTRGEVRSLVREFVESSDGEFICVIYGKSASRLLAFNDRYGRLPVFYHEGRDIFALSREVKFLLHWVQTVEVDRFGLAQFMMFGYTLGDRTLFRMVDMLAASRAVTSRFESQPPSLHVSVEEITPLNFDEIQPPPTRSQCIEQLVGLYGESISNRYTRCTELGLRNIADVSGGFDSRTVMGGLERMGGEVEYFTHRLVTGDESRVALQLGAALGKPVTVISASHERDEKEYDELLYATDGLVNGWTALTAWRDVVEKRNVIGSTAATHMGLGGGLIRHPLTWAWGHRSLGSMLRANALRCSLSPEWAAFLAGLSLEELLSGCEEYFGTYAERTTAGQIKRFYYEYLHTRVSAGEDRARRLFWTVQPLAAKDVYEFEMNTMPLKFADYTFHADVLRALDPRLLSVPIHGSDIRLDSRRSVYFHNMRTQLKIQLRALVRRNRLTNRLNFHRKIKQKDRASLDTMARLIAGTHESLGGFAKCIPEQRIQKFLAQGYGMTNYDRILSVLAYFRQVEGRFSEKIGDAGP